MFRRDWLNVGDGHKVYLAQYGNPKGLPVLYLHGGPGAGCYPDEVSLFDLSRCRVLFLDQRGCGNSTPHGCIEHNDLQRLIADIEHVRLWLGIDKWCLCGGSFGATLGLIYSGLYPQSVISQIYWGLFIPSGKGVEWLYGRTGAAMHFPLEYRRFSQGLGVKSTLGDLFSLYQQGMSHADLQVQQHFINRWLVWEARLAAPQYNLPFIAGLQGQTLANIERHFASHHYFSASELMRASLEKVTAETLILQGEKDWVCPTHLLESYQQRFSQSRLRYQVIEGGYHSLAAKNMLDAVIDSLAEMAEQHY